MAKDKRSTRSLRKYLTHYQKCLVAYSQNYMCVGPVCKGQRMLPPCWEADHITPLHHFPSNTSLAQANLFRVSDTGEYEGGNWRILCANCHRMITCAQSSQASTQLREYGPRTTFQAVSTAKFLDRGRALHITPTPPPPPPPTNTQPWVTATAQPSPHTVRFFPPKIYTPGLLTSTTVETDGSNLWQNGKAWGCQDESESTANPE